MDDLFALVFDSLEYDHREDDDDVRGNWKFDRDGQDITIEYVPYSDSPFPAQTMTYRIERT